ncbi:hypothetical protein SAM19_05350 [Brevibacillus laterosporus]|nr:hypothetical protein [Brevibacillus laterosporus]
MLVEELHDYIEWCEGNKRTELDLMIDNTASIALWREEQNIHFPIRINFRKYEDTSVILELDDQMKNFLIREKELKKELSHIKKQIARLKAQSGKER